ncbi:295_t:CDS:2, partial [Gigaspora rosea]
QLLQIKRQSEASKQIAVNSERYETEIEDMIRLVESKAAILQQLKEIKQKANQIGSDYQMIHMYAQNAEKLLKIMKGQLISTDKEGIEENVQPFKHENDALRKSNELLRQQILTSENMKENLEQEIEQTNSSFEQQEALKEIEEEKCKKLINSESKVAMLLDQMESIIEVYRSIGDVFGIPNTEESPTINFKIQEPKTSEIRDDYFDNLVKEKYPDLPSFVLPEYPSSPTDTEFFEIVSFDENDSDIDIGKRMIRVLNFPTLKVVIRALKFPILKNKSI